MDTLTLEPPNPSGIRTARITGDDLPNDVWRLIASYVFTDHCRTHDNSRVTRYISVNRTFFDFVLSNKYGSVNWFGLDRTFVRILKRLQEPLIAGYVQKLFIRAWFINFLFKREELLHSTSKKSNNWERATGISALTRLTQRLLRRKNILPSKSGLEFQRNWERGKLAEGSPSKAVVNMLVHAVSGMRNVTELNFEWRDLPVNKHTSIFLTSMRTAFDTSLRKLVLRAQIPQFKEFLAITNFDNIDELDLHFDYRPRGSPDSVTGAKRLTKYLRFVNEESPANITAPTNPDVEDLQNTVVPFVAHCRAQLRTLAISSSANVDLSQFFNAIPPLHSLRRFCIRISFDNQTLSDASGLFRVLQNGKSTLLHVSFEPELPDNSLNNSFNPDTFTRADALKQRRASWAPINQQLLRLRECLCNLESLKIPFVSLAETVPLISRSCDTLGRLCLTDHFLTIQELSALAEIFAHCPFELQHLQIEIAYLDFALVKMLASRFPGLDSLVLIYKAYEYPFSDALVKHTAIPDWKLSNVQVFGERYTNAHVGGVPRLLSGVHAINEAVIEKHFSLWIPNLHTQSDVPSSCSDQWSVSITDED